MCSKDGAKVSKLLRRVYKNITLVIFYVLPTKVSLVFLELSVANLITNVRGNERIEDCFDVNKFCDLIHVNYSKDVGALPEYTLSWFWDDSFLNKHILTRDGSLLVKDILKNDTLLKRNIGTVATNIVDQLPYLMKLKLKVKQPSRRLRVKHEIASLINHGLVMS